MKKLLIIPLLLLSIILSYSPAYNKDIRITSYHPNDSTKSSKCTASGYCTKDFEINDEGIYTFQNKIVIATATYECTKRKDGVCQKFSPV